MVLMALNAILGFEMLSSFCHLTPPSVCVTRVTPLEPCNRLYRRLFSGSASSNEIGRILRTAMHIEEFDIWYIFKSVTRDSNAHSWHHVSRVTLENVKFLGENDYKRNTWYMYSSRGLRDSKARHCHYWHHEITVTPSSLLEAILCKFEKCTKFSRRKY